MDRIKGKKDSVESDGKYSYNKDVVNIKYIIHETPKICLIDMSENLEKKLADNSYCFTKGTLGYYVNVPKSQGKEDLIKPLFSFPKNLHEHNIVIIDLNTQKTIEVEQATANLKKLSGSYIDVLLSEYPEQVFNSRALGASVLNSVIKDVLKKESIVILFADRCLNVEYKEVRIGNGQSRVINNFSCNSLRVCDGIYETANKYGTMLKVSDEANMLTPVLEKHLPGADYHVVFLTPYDYSSHKLRDDFVPLVLNDSGEIVSYYTRVDKGSLFVFPQIQDKDEFIMDLFKNVLAEAFPNIFPYSGTFAWIDDGSYPLPGEAELCVAREEIKHSFKTQLSENKQALDKLKSDYRFIRQMLTETGGTLVNSVTEFLRWAGFESVLSMDEHNVDVLEEDIQVELKPGILVIEVKGIGGTSKDNECAQINKIKNRRSKQLKSFDVHGLYIVNHQRYISPKKRNNPPFTPHQITDAETDDRGLVTTYELYKAYFLENDGLITKAKIREQLLKVGNIHFEPEEMLPIGFATEIFQQGKVVIVNLEDHIVVTIDMKLVTHRNGEYIVHKIVSLQSDGKDVTKTQGGEIGIKIESVIRKSDEIYLLAGNNS